MEDMVSKKFILDALMDEIVRLIAEKQPGGTGGTGPGNQTAKADAGKLQYTLVPLEVLEVVAAVRMYGSLKYKDQDNWKRVEKGRYRDAAFRHFAAYLREPYGLDSESNLPHLYHLATNIAFLCALEIQDGTLPAAQDAVKRMRMPKPAREA